MRGGKNRSGWSPRPTKSRPQTPYAAARKNRHFGDLAEPEMDTTGPVPTLEPVDFLPNRLEKTLTLCAEKSYVKICGKGQNP